MSESQLGIGPRFAQRIKANISNAHREVPSPVSMEEQTGKVIDQGQNPTSDSSRDDRSKSIWKTKITTSN